MLFCYTNLETFVMCNLNPTVAVLGQRLGTISLPTVTIRSKTYVTDYGNSITIACSVSANPKHIAVKWQKMINQETKDIFFGDEGTQGVTIEDPSLTITFTTSFDTGQYTCFATNAVGTGKSLPVTLTVQAGLPTVSVASTSYTASVGFSVTLVCSVVSNPPCTKVYWQRIVDGVATTINAGSVGIEGSTPHFPSIIISAVTSSMSGEYTCYAANIVGTSSSLPIVLIVKELQVSETEVKTSGSSENSDHE